MLISIITLFPEMFEGVFTHSIVKRGQQKELLTIRFINHRDFGIGTGDGLLAEPDFSAAQRMKARHRPEKRGLAAARGTQDAEELSFADV